MVLSMMTSSKKDDGEMSQHEGFNYWKDEFVQTVRDIERELHQSPVGYRKMNKLLKEATSTILPNLLQEVHRVSKTKQPALRQEMMDYYRACKQQLATYQQINEQWDDFGSSNRDDGHDEQQPNTKSHSQQQYH